ncbi:MAG TPA: hypothetical protein VD997_05700 [Phycisphaerales bacterium]|nr:hypothetical protein [Phycisphaerales bacterium]
MSWFRRDLRVARAPVTTALPAPMEALEGRALLSAPTPTISGMWSDATNLYVRVDWGNVNTATIGNGDLQVQLGTRTPIVGTLAAAPVLVNGKQRATYRFKAYDNAWGVTDNGTYTITSPIGQVLSPQGDALDDAQLTTRNLSWATPKARLVSNTMRATDWLVVIQYDTIGGLNQSTIDGSDLTVALGANTGVTVHQIINVSANTTKVVYRIGAQDGAWSYTANGTYRLTIGVDKVRDNAARAVTAHTYRDFGLFFGTPKAVVQTDSVNENDWVIPVKFSALSPSAIHPAGLVTAGAMTIVGPGGFTANSITSQLLHNPDGSYTAYFTFNARGGAWDYRDGGTYTLKINSNKVKDTSNRFIPVYDLKSYNLSFSTPTAEVLLPANPTLTRWDVNVRFMDDTSINRSTINVDSIRIVGPDGLELSKSLVSISGATNGAIQTALFRLNAPGGFENGTYRFFINRDGVRDSGGRISAENQIWEFTVNF